MFCPNCGTHNDGGAFCPQCGTSLGGSAPQQSQQPLMPPPPQAPQPPMPPQGNYYAPPQQGYQSQPYGQAPVMAAKKTNTNTIVGIVVVAVVVIVLAVVAFLIIRSVSSPLVGTWEGTSDGYDVTITFKGDGAVIFQLDSEKMTGKYKVLSRTEVQLKDFEESAMDDVTLTYKISKENGKQMLKLTADGDTVTLYKK